MLSPMLGFVSWSPCAASPDKADHLFFIERSINKNLVQYDIRLTENGDLVDSRPVHVYWILENGRREGLNAIEQKYAYGIVRQEKLDGNKFKVILAAFKGLQVIVERVNDSFKALVTINGKQTILEKLYIKSENSSNGLPKVLYIEVFGWTEKTGHSIKERIALR